MTIKIGQVYEKVDGPGWHWQTQLGRLVIITQASTDLITYRYLSETHSTNTRDIKGFIGRFKLVEYD